MIHPRPYPAAVALSLAIVLLLGACGRTARDDGRGVAASQPTTQPTTHPATAAVAAADPRESSLSGVTQLTFGFERAGEAYFSADGQWIIFQATPRGEQHYQMYVARLGRTGDRIDGIGTPVRISAKGSRNTCGFFSPDGRSLIFASTAGKDDDADAPPAGYQRQGGNYRWDFPTGMEIYRADDWRAPVEQVMKLTEHVVDGFGAKVPGTDGSGADTIAAIVLPTVAMTSNNAYDAEGAYSPDGKWIVFGSLRDGDSELYAMRPDGSKSARLTQAKGYDGGPFFAPDGKRIVYRSDRKGNDLLQVFTADVVFDAAGDITGITGEKQLTDDANVNWGPYWHPDGKHIVYATSAHGHHNYELYWMNADGSGKTRVTFAAGFDGLPVFSNDGKHLMWSSKRTTDNTTQVFAARFRTP